MSRRVETWRLRAQFAAELSRMNGSEVPAYSTLVQVCTEVNRDCAGGAPDTRVTAERHGAIRVGSVSELADAADLFAAFGMYPVGIYDLRPTHADQLARNPFQLFVDADTQAACVSDNSDYNPDWLAGQIGHHIHDPYELYEKAAS